LSDSGGTGWTRSVGGSRVARKMYAISHAATALLLKRRYPEAPIWPLLISVQLVELLWVGLTFAGIEHFAIAGDHVRLDFLPYSHSVVSGVGLGLAAWAVAAFIFGQRRLGVALALGVVSHILLDAIHHAPDIHLLPIAGGPVFGLNLQSWPLADLLVELAYGWVCWRLFGGRRSLLGAIVVFNLLDIPLMFPQPGTGAMLSAHPAILPALILVQIIASWVAVWWLSLPKEIPRSSP
jgi:hypothetical protein